jgi:hypothetical protein
MIRAQCFSRFFVEIGTLKPGKNHAKKRGFFFVEGGDDRTGIYAPPASLVETGTKLAELAITGTPPSLPLTVLS